MRVPTLGIVVVAILAWVLFEGYLGVSTPGDVRIDIESESVRAESGYAYTVALPDDLIGDSIQGGHQSAILLFEDGVRLGPPHSIHEQIRQHGGGRYSHWGKQLYFSSSDNDSSAFEEHAYAVVLPGGLSSEANQRLSVARLCASVGLMLFLLLRVRAVTMRHDPPDFAPRLVVLAGAILAAIVAFNFSLLEFVSSHYQQFELNGIAPVEGRAFRASINSLNPPLGDDNTNILRSNLVVFEDGRKLGPAHSPAELIMRYGGGAYSHWNLQVTFSSSDGTDPQINGRSYMLREPVSLWLDVLRGLLNLAGLFAVCLLGCRLSGHPSHIERWMRRYKILWIWSLTALFLGSIWLFGLDATGGRQSSYWLLASLVALGSLLWSARSLDFLSDSQFGVAATGLVVAAVVVWCWWFWYSLFPGHVLLAPDSVSYYEMAPYRPPGYGVFLHALVWLTGDVDGTLAAQIGLLLISLLLLSYAIGRITQLWWVGPLIVLLVATSQPLLLGMGWMLSDLLFAITVILFAAACCHFIVEQSRPSAILIGVAIGLSLVLRPIGYVLLAVIPCVTIINFRRTRFKPLLAMLLPAIFGLGLAIHGEIGPSTTGTQSIGPLALIGHVGWAVKSDANGKYPEVNAAIEERLRPLLSKRPEALTFPRMYQAYTAKEYNQLLWINIAPILQEYAADHAPDVTVDDLASTIALETISREPLGYARHAFAHYLGLWDLLFYRTQSTTLNVYSAYDSTARLLEPEEYLHIADPRRYELGEPVEYFVESPIDTINLWVGGRLGDLLSVLVLLISLLAVLGALVKRFDLSGIEMAIVVMSLLLHGYFLLTSLLQVAIHRYAWPVESLAWSILCLGLAWLIQSAQARVLSR